MKIEDLEVGKFYKSVHNDIVELIAIRDNNFVFLEEDGRARAYYRYSFIDYLTALTEIKPPLKLKGYANVYSHGLFKYDTIEETQQNRGGDCLGTIDLSTLTRDNLVGDKT